MKRTANTKKPGSRATPVGRTAASRPRGFVVCIRNDGYEASLERNKIYAVLPDDDAEHDGDLRVVDESGDDYLFSAPCPTSSPP